MLTRFTGRLSADFTARKESTTTPPGDTTRRPEEFACIDSALASAGVEPLEFISLERRNIERELGQPSRENIDRAHRLALRRVVELSLNDPAQRFVMTRSGHLCCRVCRSPQDSCDCTGATARITAAAVVRDRPGDARGLLRHSSARVRERYSLWFSELLELMEDQRAKSAWALFPNRVVESVRGALALALLVHQGRVHGGNNGCCRSTVPELVNAVDDWIARSEDALAIRRLTAESAPP
jgi:hypothetical protein